jgi:large repetitive protein
LSLPAVGLVMAQIVVAAPPSASFTISDEVPEIGQPVSFAATVTDEDVDDTHAFAWTFGDGTTGSGMNPSHEYDTAGLMTVTLTVTDLPGGQTTTVSHQLRVNTPPTAAFDFAPASPDPNQTITFTSVSTDPEGAVAHAWDLDNDGSFDDGSDPSEQWSFATGGIRTVRLRVTDSDGAQRETSRTVPVFNNVPPEANFTFTGTNPVTPTVPDTGETINFVSTSTDADGDNTIVDARWDLDGDGQFDDRVGPNVQHAFATAGTKTVGLLVRDASGATDSVTKLVPVNALPNAPPRAGFNVAPANPFAGDQMTILSTSMDPDGSLVAQQWDLDADGQFDDASGPLVTAKYVTPGRHEIRLRVIDSQGAAATASGAVDVQKRPLLLLPDVVIDINGSVTGAFTRVGLLRVQAPAGTTVLVICKGKGCPKQVTKRGKGRALRFKAFERRLRAGTKLIVRVIKPGFIGRQSTWTMRVGKRPKRVNRCVFPGAQKATKCPLP